jgi:hypothetical protein
VVVVWDPRLIHGSVHVSVTVEYFLYSGRDEHSDGDTPETLESGTDVRQGYREGSSFTLPPCPYFGSRLLSSFSFFLGVSIGF